MKKSENFHFFSLHDSFLEKKKYYIKNDSQSIINVVGYRRIMKKSSKYVIMSLESINSSYIKKLFEEVLSQRMTIKQMIYALQDIDELEALLVNADFFSRRTMTAEELQLMLKEATKSNKQHLVEQNKQILNQMLINNISLTNHSQKRALRKQI